MLFYELSLETRLIAALLGKYYPQAFSLKTLRNYPDSKNYFVTRLRYFSHAFALNDRIGSPQKEKREGFHESFTIPRIASSFETFAKKTGSLDNPSLEWILSRFTQTTISETLTEQDLKIIKKTVRDPQFIGPIIVGSGYDWHFTGEIIFGNYLLRCNRGRSAEKFGIDIYEIEDKSQISLDQIRLLAKRQEYTSFVQLDNIKPFFTHEMPKQEGGHCTETSAEAILLACIAIKILLNSYQKDSAIKIEDIPPEAWHRAFGKAEIIFRQWDIFDKENVLKELALSASASLKAEDIELQKFYALLIHDLIEKADRKFTRISAKKNL